MSYCVDAGVVSGKRQRKFFKIKKEAEDYATNLKRLRREEGSVAFTLTPEQRFEAARAFGRLAEYNASLTEAVEFFVRHARPKGGKKSVQEAAAELLNAKERAGKKRRYLKELRCKLNKFARAFPDRLLNEVTHADFEQWMHSQNWCPLTKTNYIRDLGILFRFGVKRGYCAENPIALVEKPQVPETEIKILSVTQSLRLLFAAYMLPKLKMVPYTAIGLFAGLRASELQKLDWSNVNLRMGTIKVTASTSKTGQHRFVKISENLKAWLRRYAKENGPVTPPNLYDRRRKVRDLAELDTWPENSLRHSFGSYHYAFHQDAGLTAAQLGHESTKMLFRHYRQPVERSTAAEFWAILPPKPETPWAIQAPSGFAPEQTTNNDLAAEIRMLLAKHENRQQQLPPDVKKAA